MAIEETLTVVEFRNVGMGHKSWTDSWAGPLTHARMVRSIKAQGALGSREIDFVFDDDGVNGRIYVGIFRRVGEFTVKAEAQ